MADLEALFDTIAHDSGVARADAYLRRIERRCAMLDSFPHAGRALGVGLRIIGFERRVTIAYLVEADGVFVQRVLYAGLALDPPAG